MRIRIFNVYFYLLYLPTLISQIHVRHFQIFCYRQTAIEPTILIIVKNESL